MNSKLQICVYMYLRHNVRKRTFGYVPPSEDSDQPVHSRRLIRIFTGCILDSHCCKVFFMRTTNSHQSAQAELSLYLAHMSESTFSHIAIYLFSPFSCREAHQLIHHAASKGVKEAHRVLNEVCSRGGCR